MGIILKVTPEVLERMADDIGRQITDIQNQFRTVDEKIGATRSFWEGDASDSHMNQYDALKDEIADAVKRLKSHPVNLLQMAGLYEENEERLKGEAQSLSADVIV